MKKAFFILICSIFFLNLTQASTSAYRQAAGSDQMFTQYDQKRSKWCNVMRASKCADPAGFQQYLKYGCINDLDKESKCLKTFCTQNCASLAGCPTGQLESMCKDHCQKVNLGNSAAQNRLNACISGSYTSQEAADKSARRDFYRAQQKDLRGGQKAALKEAQKVLDLVNNLSKKRQALFYVDGASLSKAGIVRIDDFIRNVQQAIALTDQMNRAVKALEVSGQAPEVVAQARALMAKSDQQVQYFVGVVQQLSMGAQRLMQVVAQGARPTPRTRPASTYSSASSTDSAFSSPAE